MTDPRASRPAPLCVRLITFDLDGTLVDTASEIAEAANRTLHEIGLPRRPLPDVTRLIGHGTRELMRGLLAQAVEAGAARAEALDLDAIMRRFESHYHDTTGTDSQLYPGCLEGLTRLRDAGIQMACVTNKEHRFAVRVLQSTGLSGFFRLVVGGDSLAQKKPHPAVIEYCLEALAVPQSQAAHLGDSSIDVDTARRAGVAAWAVPYGYNGGQPIEASHPDIVFPGVDAVADHVLSVAAKAA
ncbi:MAG TPA: HAD-IA family hydrolase [Candidatus Aquabacterium excrementipullorum]|nr:HAD-IA family hydrolase [Candidatus Aquabacterium excrementipullorum]